MATIRNTITLQDRMTPALQNLVDGLNATANAMSGVNSASNSTFQNASSNVTGTQHGLNNINHTLEEMPSAQDIVRRGFSNWQSAIITANQLLEIARKIINSISSGLKAVSEMTDQQARLKRLAASEEDLYDLQQKIAAAADATRSSYEDTQASTLTMYNNLKGIGVTQEQSIRLAEILNKQLGADGVKGAAASSVLYQLGQSLAAGQVRYQDWKLIVANAPGMVERIAKAAGMTSAAFNQAVEAGKVSAADFAKYLANSGAEIDAIYEEMPDTFVDQIERVKTSAKAKLLGQGGLQSIISAALNSDGWNTFLTNGMNTINRFLDWSSAITQRIVSIFSKPEVQATLTQWSRLLIIVVNALGWVLNAAVSVFDFFVSNWSLIAPIIGGIVGVLLAYKAATLGVLLATKLASAAETLALFVMIAKSNGLKAAIFDMLAYVGAGNVKAASDMMQAGATFKATAAQYGFNAALLACPLTWIILLIIAVIAVIFLVVAAINKATDSTISAFGVIIGALYAVGATVLNIVIGVINGVLQLIWSAFQPIIGAVEWILNVFNGGFNSFGGAVANLLGNIIGWFLDLGKVVTKIIDAIFGTNWTAGLDGLSNKVKSWGKNENAITLATEAPQIQRLSVTDAYNKGYGAGGDIQKKIQDMTGTGLTGMDLDKLVDGAESATNLDDLATGGGINTNGEVEISEEDLRYLKDVAQAEWVNKYTTLRPEMTVTFGDVHETADVNKILSTMEDMVAEAYASALVE